MSEPQFSNYPDLQLAQHVFTITNSYASHAAQQASYAALEDAIKERAMAPLYMQLAHPQDGILNQSGEGSSKVGRTGAPQQASKPLSVSLSWNAGLYEDLKAKNDAELEAIQKEENEALEKAGESEVQAARAKRAEFWARVGDKDKAISAYEALFDTAILGKKIDLCFALIRLGLFFNDDVFVSKTVDRAHVLVESGGDWDRRNRLKAYSGLHLLTIRSYTSAAPLLLDSLSTFTSNELCSYPSLIIYAVLAGSVSLNRVDFKSKVVDAPEIRAILGTGISQDTTQKTTPGPTVVNLTTLGHDKATEEPVEFGPLSGLVNSLYAGDYKSFFSSLAEVETSFLSLDRYLAEHKTWFVREMRLRAYQQLLQSYRVVGLDSMASEFGVTVDFLDKYVMCSTRTDGSDLKNFVAADRLSCTVDRVHGVIETNRPDEKNKQYNEIVKQGDQLITKLQRYGQVVRLKEG